MIVCAARPAERGEEQRARVTLEEARTKFSAALELHIASMRKDPATGRRHARTTKFWRQ